MMKVSSMQTSDVMLSRENNLCGDECVLPMLLSMRGDYYETKAKWGKLRLNEREREKENESHDVPLESVTKFQMYVSRNMLTNIFPILWEI